MRGEGHERSSPQASAAQESTQLDIAGMQRWLVSEAIVSADGAILSWSNPNHPGYPYAEVAGLLLSSLATIPVNAETQARADHTAAWLCRSIDACGGVGRDGIIYLFDSAVALTGLLRYRAARGNVDVDDSIHRLRRFVGSMVAVGTAVAPWSAAADGRWSTQFGAHLVKCLHGLYLYAETFGEPVHEEVARALIDRSGHQPSPLYVHPFCYEQEGHLLAAHHGLSDLFEPIDGALDLLAALQQADGSILAFANGIDGFGEPRSDATAQAVRLWALCDRTGYADAIERALAFLATCQTPEGGIRYAPGRDDVCSWSTMFTLQAAEWSMHGPRMTEML